MYRNIFYDRKSNVVHLWDDDQGYIQFEYEPYAYKKRQGGSYTSIYGDELEKVTDYKDYDEGLFESDVLPETRTLIDLYGDQDDVSEGNIVLNYDIEVETEGGYATPDDPWQEIISVAFKDSVSNIRRVYVVDKDEIVQDAEYEDDIGDVIIRRFDCEEDLILEFLDEYEDIRPNILTGWNIDGFDNPYTFNRIKKVLGRKVASRLSPIGIAYCSPQRNDGSYVMTIAGVSSLDYLNLYKQFTYTEQTNYRLGTIGMIEVGMDKMEYDADLKTLFETDIKAFCQYNLTDIDIVDAIDNKNKFIELAITICHICHVPYDFIQYSSKFLEGALLTYLRKKDLIAPNKPKRKRKDDDDDDVGFEGAYVKKPVPGKYDWVFDLDLTSLYPSIIMSLNISPETLFGKVFSHIEPEKPKEGGKKNEVIPAHPAWSPENFAVNKIEKVFLTEESAWKDNPIGKDTISIDEFRQRLVDDGLSIASNGALYTNDKVGLLGDILDTWFKQRVEFRKLEREHGKAGNDELYKFYNKRQKVQKILLNSLYGVLGLSIFRFYNLVNAEAVTLTGQTIIKTSAKMGNQFYNKTLGTTDVDYCIYTDTDSTFFSALPIIKHTMPDVDITDDNQMADAVRSVADDVQKTLNNGYDIMSPRMFNIDPSKHRFDIKQELVSKRAIWIVKKRYVQWVIDEGGVPKNELDIKGLDVVRSSFPTKFREFMYTTEKDADGNKVESGILVDFIKDTPKAEVDAKILDFKRKLSTFEIVDIARNTGVKDIAKFEKYCKTAVMGEFPKIVEDGKTKGYPAHVKAAITFNKFLKHHGLDKSVEPIRNGEKIKYVYVKRNFLGIEEIAFRGYHDPKELMDFIQTYADGKLLYEKEMAKKLDDFYNALKWDYPSEGAAIIDAYFGDTEETQTIKVNKPKKEPKKELKNSDKAGEFFSF